MTPEERMLERFTRERQRASRGDAFNLEDEEELTHYGQNLSKFDDFDNVGFGLDDEEEDGGQIDRMTVQKSHFGGFDDEAADDDDEGQVCTASCSIGNVLLYFDLDSSQKGKGLKPKSCRKLWQRAKNTRYIISHHIFNLVCSLIVS